MSGISRVVKSALAGAMVMGSLLAVPLACAGEAGAAQTMTVDDSAWKDVRARGELRCGAAVSAPYVVRDARSGQYSGVFAELCEHFAIDVLKVKPVFADANWDNIIAGLQSGKWDISLALNDTPERRKAVQFSDSATDYSVSFAYNSKNPKTGQAPASLDDIDQPGTSIVVTSGTAQDKAITGVIRNAKVLRLPGADENRLALMSRRAQYLADDSMSNQLLVAAHPDWAAAFTPVPALAPQRIAFGLRLQTPQADIDLFNRYLQQQIDSGNVARMISQSVDATTQQAH